MTLLQKMDAALVLICAVATVIDWQSTELVMTIIWAASAVFCAMSCYFSWADKLMLIFKPALARLAIMRSLGGQ